MNQISNTELFKTKERIIQSFKDEYLKQDTYFQTNVNYHSLKLKFLSSSKNFIDQIETMVPKDWLFFDSSYEYEIFFYSPNDFYISDEIFSDESSQDCFSFQDNSQAIQRDFVAQVINQKVIVICQEGITDGFYNFLRWFISERLIAKNKFVLHCSSVLDVHGLAHVFLGHSGAGKTTTTFLSKPRLVLGDDMNILSLNDHSEVLVEAGAIGGLFNSDVGYGTKFKVKGIYWLNKADIVKIEQCDSIESTQKILASFANICWEYCSDKTTNELMKMANATAEKVPVNLLSFKKDDSFWKLIE